jgi:hypothetical protein
MIPIYLIQTRFLIGFLSMVMSRSLERLFPLLSQSTNHRACLYRYGCSYGDSGYLVKYI